MAQGVDYAELCNLAVEAVGKHFPVAACGLHAGMDGKVLAGVVGQPLEEFGMAFGGVGELASGDGFSAPGALEGGVVVGLGDVDPQAEFVI